MKPYIVFFDGICNLCNSTVQFLIKKDKNNRLKFASLQSETGQRFLNERNLPSNRFDSVILYNPDTAYYTQSTAILKIAKILGFPYNLLVVFYIVPAPIRNIIYNWIAQNRYKWFGKKNNCMIPSPELKEKFLD